jgi:reactive intermediate/imine deaminase
MKKMIIAILIITSSCVGTRTYNYNNGPSTQIDYYVSENTKKLDFPFSDATIVDNVIYVSGQVGTLAGTRELIEGGIVNETTQALKNINSILEDIGSSSNKIFKCLCMLNDIEDYGEMNEAYVKFFNKRKSMPSRSTFGAKIALNGKIEIECWAVK